MRAGASTRVAAAGGDTHPRRGAPMPAPDPLYPALLGLLQAVGAVPPYPWPKGAFTPTACALIRLVAACWPAGAPRPHLVADRGFASRAVLLEARRAGWGCTVRLRAQSPVTAAGAPGTAGSLAE